MKKTIQIINHLKESGVIDAYAIGGATALLFYAEPTLTFDIDIFIFLPNQNEKSLIDLSGLYDTLRNEGYQAEKEHVMIEGVPVQFIPAYNKLITEAVKESATKEYEGINVKVLTLEYLLAIMIDTNRPKDRERIQQLLGEVSFEKNKLESILKRFSLQAKWEKYFEGK